MPGIIAAVWQVLFCLVWVFAYTKPVLDVLVKYIIRPVVNLCYLVVVWSRYLLCRVRGHRGTYSAEFYHCRPFGIGGGNKINLIICATCQKTLERSEVEF